MINKKIGIIGCGNMGGAILEAILKKRLARSNKTIAFDRAKEKSRLFKKKFKVKTADSNIDLVREADIVIIAVKPQDIEGLMGQIGDYFISGKMIISIAAGVKTERIAGFLSKDVSVIRAMPNIPALVGEAMTFISAKRGAKNAQKTIAMQIFSCLGQVEEIDEKFLDAATALSGSGPAYFFYLMELIMQMGVSFGIKREVSRKLAAQTALGSAKLAIESQSAFEELRRKVASKGGTTEAAFSVLRRYRFDKIVKKAIVTAYKRSRQLSK